MQPIFDGYRFLQTTFSPEIQVLIKTAYPYQIIQEVVYTCLERLLRLVLKKHNTTLARYLIEAVDNKCFE